MTSFVLSRWINQVAAGLARLFFWRIQTSQFLISEGRSMNKELHHIFQVQPHRTFENIQDLEINIGLKRRHLFQYLFLFPLNLVFKSPMLDYTSYVVSLFFSSPIFHVTELRFDLILDGYGGSSLSDWFGHSSMFSLDPYISQFSHAFSPQSNVACSFCLLHISFLVMYIS